MDAVQEAHPYLLHHTEELLTKQCLPVLCGSTHTLDTHTHTLYFSRHCLPVRPATCSATAAQFRASGAQPASWMAPSSCSTSRVLHFLLWFRRESWEGERVSPLIRAAGTQVCAPHFKYHSLSFTLIHALYPSN